jgi:hypothetical protein
LRGGFVPSRTPLLIVDDVILLPAELDVAARGSGKPYSPPRVATVEYFAGNKAAALYGQRAMKAGVFLITSRAK